MADACLEAIGVATTADAVARHYGARSVGGLLDGWLVDTRDAHVVPGLCADGIETLAVPLIMSDLVATAAMVQAALGLAAALRAAR
jgi:LPPG:FO 2-phospho-L-lactate transferase